jgi:hypothetical protein
MQSKGLLKAYMPQDCKGSAHTYSRHLHVFAVSGSGSTPFTRVLIMVFIFILMATAGIEHGTF